MFKNAADVLFVSRKTGISRAQIAYLRSFTRYGLGFGRVCASGKLKLPPYR